MDIDAAAALIDPAMFKGTPDEDLTEETLKRRNAAREVARHIAAHTWNEGFERAYRLARGWGHPDYWEDWGVNPYNGKDAEV